MVYQAAPAKARVRPNGVPSALPLHLTHSPSDIHPSRTRTVARGLHLEQQYGNGCHMAHVPSNPKDIHGARPPALAPPAPGSRGGASRRDGAAVATTPAKRGGREEGGVMVGGEPR